jgi:hypothetical protein
MLTVIFVVACIAGLASLRYLVPIYRAKWHIEQTPSPWHQDDADLAKRYAAMLERAARNTCPADYARCKADPVGLYSWALEQVRENRVGMCQQIEQTEALVLFMGGGLNDYEAERVRS